MPQRINKLNSVGVYPKPHKMGKAPKTAGQGDPIGKRPRLSGELEIA